MATIYILTNIHNGKQYIGKTTRGLDQRLSEHIVDAFKYKKRRALSNAIRKYGIENFHIECLTVTDKLVNLWEKHLIKQWCSRIPNGYNISRGGDGFNRGHKPWNKGKSLGFTPKRAFKKGNVPWNAGTNPIVIMTQDNKEHIFEKQSDVCVRYNIHPGNLNKVLRGVINQTGGLRARYLDE